MTNIRLTTAEQYRRENRRTVLRALSVALGEAALLAAFFAVLYAALTATCVSMHGVAACTMEASDE